MTVDANGASVGVEGTGVIAQALFVQARDAVKQLHLGEGVLRETDLHLEHADQLLVLARGVVHGLEHGGGRERRLLTVLDAFERAQGRRVIRLNVEDLAVQLDRAIDVAQVLLVQLGDAVLVAHRFGRVGRELGLVLQNAEQLLPVAGSLVEHVQTAQCGEVVRVELEHLLVGIDRAAHVR